MSVCCECCVLSGRGLCDGLITRPGKSYRRALCLSVIVKPRKIRRPRPLSHWKNNNGTNNYISSSTSGSNSSSSVTMFFAPLYPIWGHTRVASHGHKNLSLASHGHKNVSVASHGHKNLSVASHGHKNLSVASQDLCFKCILERHNHTSRTDWKAKLQLIEGHRTHTRAHTHTNTKTPPNVKVFGVFDDHVYLKCMTFRNLFHMFWQ
jgi:hypothetical protein